jgi:UDP:flavonoid glycosyltransferase YjiC (YdhE family)
VSTLRQLRLKAPYTYL